MPLFDALLQPEHERDVGRVLLAASGGTPGSAVAEFEIDTHKVKEPFTIKGFLSDWFLALIGVGLLIAAVVFIAAFAKKKRKTDQEELGGE